MEGVSRHYVHKDQFPCCTYFATAITNLLIDIVISEDFVD